MTCTYLGFIGLNAACRYLGTLLCYTITLAPLGTLPHSVLPPSLPEHWITLMYTLTPYLPLL